MFKPGDKVFFLEICGVNINLLPFTPYEVISENNGLLDVQDGLGRTGTTAYDPYPASPLFLQLVQNGQNYKWLSR